MDKKLCTEAEKQKVKEVFDLKIKGMDLEGIDLHDSVEEKIWPCSKHR